MYVGNVSMYLVRECFDTLDTNMAALEAESREQTDLHPNTTRR
jgi:hypothetical protein